MKGILLGCACVIGNLQLGSALGGILEEVDIAASIKSVVRRIHGGIFQVIVDIGETGMLSVPHLFLPRRTAHRVVRRFSPGPAGIVISSLLPP